MQEIKKISSEVVHKNPWWDYKRDQFVLPDGGINDYYYSETHGNVIVIPVLDDGRLVLVRQYRYLHEKNSIEFPGGGIHADESPVDAANREFLEETGYKTENLIKIGTFEPCIGMLKDISHIFIANELTEMQQPKSEGMEHTEVILRRVDEFENMIKQGEIWDGQVLAAWAMARDFLLKG
ncbi:MAG: ADP-ribose pyrophosphatase [Parcubacteria group bacterium Gr01-1014_13]|nr:MAG: ADP-ribose pyrophosphatase [Parcubacteria group bacterium Gr01-1014_13]